MKNSSLAIKLKLGKFHWWCQRFGQLGLSLTPGYQKLKSSFKAKYLLTYSHVGSQQACTIWKILMKWFKNGSATGTLNHSGKNGTRLSSFYVKTCLDKARLNLTTGTKLEKNRNVFRSRTISLSHWLIPGTILLG